MQNQPNAIPGEIWQDYNEYYMLSNMGRWWSKRKNKIMKQYINNSGYNIIHFKKNGKSKGIFTHIKVCELFGDKNGTKIPHWKESTLRELNLSIDHLNRDKQNNTYLNLEVVTHSENCRRKFEREQELSDIDITDIF
mgnify:CR=1 FL=1